jgi:hypothetical protein
VRLSCTIGEELYPHPQWRRLAALWAALYPPQGLAEEYRGLLGQLEATMPALARLLAEHRPARLRGRSLREVMPTAERGPERLLALHHAWNGSLPAMAEMPPSLVFAVLGQARAAGTLAPEVESRVLVELLRSWALRSALDVSAICARRTRPARPMVSTQKQENSYANV